VQPTLSLLSLCSSNRLKAAEDAEAETEQDKPRDNDKVSKNNDKVSENVIYAI